tara:strand:- start:563 stop:1081 length:519 start_codon:yes stop_codon:yes gene_type:complete
MALWGNNDNVDSVGTVGLNYSTGVVTGAGTSFGNAGSAQVGDVIRFTKSGTYYGDAVIKEIASTTSLTIGSTAGLSGAAISGSDFTISQLPKYTILDSTYSETRTDADVRVYGVDADAVGRTENTVYEAGVGWVGVTTYVDMHGTLRVKKETLVAMSGIGTGNVPLYNNPPA